jgi:hypothetical protein
VAELALRDMNANSRLRQRIVDAGPVMRAHARARDVRRSHRHRRALRQ